MWQYNQTPNPDELIHGIFGSSRKNHRYIAKIGTGKNAKYFYTQAELAAYRAGKTLGKTAKDIGDAVGNYVKGAKKDYGKALSSKDEAAAYVKAKNKAQSANNAYIRQKNNVDTAHTANAIANMPFGGSKKKRAKTKAELDSNNTRLKQKQLAYNKASAESDAAYDRLMKSKTITGKVEAVGKTLGNRVVKATKPSRNAIKNYAKGVAKDYGKALSSKDEQKRFSEDFANSFNAKSRKTSAENAYNRAVKEHEKAINGPRDTHTLSNARKNRDKAYTNYSKASADYDNALDTASKSLKSYKSAKTLVGKAEDVAATFKKRNSKKKTKKY